MVDKGGGTVQNTLEGGGTEKRGGETKILKRGGEMGQGVGDLKKGGSGTPLWTMYKYYIPRDRYLYIPI